MASEVHANALLVPLTACESPPRHSLAIDGAGLQRPFTASGARKTRLLAVQVHFGEHLDRLHATDDDTSGADAGSRRPPSTYVALRVSRRDTGSHFTQAARSPPRHPSRDGEEEEDQGWYELKSTPFATSRVVERSAHPMWNELLLVPVPIEWREQADATLWKLRVDVVRRDPSQQEDALLATVELPLHTLATHRAPQHLMVPLTRSEMKDHAPCVFMSLSETDHLTAPENVDDVILQEAISTSRQSVMGAVVVLANSPLSQTQNLRDMFTTHKGGSGGVGGVGCNIVWISPMSRYKEEHTDGKHQLQWQFPALFAHNHSNRGGDASDAVEATEQLHAQLYVVTRLGESSDRPQFACVASAVADLRSIPQNGRPSPLEIALHHTEPAGDGASSPTTTQVKLLLRRWTASSWLQFQSSSVSRRIITTNRRHPKRAELHALEWTGALCRGLSRYPISSFSDEGGLSALLASYLAASSGLTHGNDGGQHGATPLPPADPNTGVRLPDDLLNQHIHLLQQEVMAKQEAINKLQRDVDARLAALHTCGTELVAARKAVRAKDELVAQLQAKIHTMEQREADQTQELLLASSGSSGITDLRVDAQTTQRMNLLIVKFKDLEQRHQATEAELMDAKRAVSGLEQLERKYAELEHAHVVQAALVQRLQKDKSQSGELQRTIRMQEKVIHKLEKAVMQQHNQQQQHSQQKSVPSSNDHARTRTDSAKDSPVVAMRVQVLEEQLQVNAKDAAKEIARLKMRVMELETQLSLGV